MSRSAILTPAARREVTEAVRGIARERPLVARRLCAAIVDAAYLLGRHPLAGRRAPDLVGERYRIATG